MALTFHSTTLGNGLDIVAEINPDSHSFVAGLFVKTGARDEDSRLNGVSHFLEHMMFKGSAKLPVERFHVANSMSASPKVTPASLLRSGVSSSYQYGSGTPSAPSSQRSHIARMIPSP